MKPFKKIRVIFYSVVPSPYQRDLFYTLSQDPGLDLRIYYLESACPDSPWPEKPLQPYEKVLPGFCISWGLSRFHFNWHWPRLSEVDILVFNGYQNLIAQLGLHYWAKRLPCIFWGEKMTASSQGLKGCLQQKLVQGLHQCQAIAAIGSVAQQDYQQRFPDHPVFNISYYCNLAPFRVSNPQRLHEPVTILFCGQMIHRKGVDLLLEAFERLIQSGRKARLLLVGREAELPQMLQTLPAEVIQHIEYVGFQAPEDLPQFFRQADLFVLPSRYDGWGVVVNQALGAGLAIICSDAVGAAPDLIEPGLNGNIFRSEDVDALFETLNYYLQHPQGLQLARQASLLKSEAWSPEAGAKRWIEVFDKLLTKEKFRTQDLSLPLEQT